MKLGFLTACMPERSLEEVAAWAAGNGYEALELAAWPQLGDRPFTASHVKAEAFDEAEQQRLRSALDDRGLVVSALAYYDNNLAPDPSEREEYHAHLRKCIDAAAALGGVPVGTFIGRDPGRSVAENLRDAERVFPPLVDYAGERGATDDRELRDGGLAPGRLPRQPRVLARAVGVDVLAGHLNADPSHLLWLGIDPVDALRPYVDRVAHAHAKDAEVFEDERNRFGFFGRTSTREKTRGTWAGGGTAFRVSARSTSPATSTLCTKAGSTASSRSSTRTRCGAERPSWSRPASGSRTTTCGLVVDDEGPRGPQPRQGVPGRQGAPGVDLDVLEGEVHCLLGPTAPASRR